MPDVTKRCPECKGTKGEPGRIPHSEYNATDHPRNHSESEVTMLCASPFHGCPTCGGTVERPKLRTDGLSGFCTDDFHDRKPSDPLAHDPELRAEVEQVKADLNDRKPSDSPTEEREGKEAFAAFLALGLGIKAESAALRIQGVSDKRRRQVEALQAEVERLRGKLEQLSAWGLLHLPHDKAQVHARRIATALSPQPEERKG